MLTKLELKIVSFYVYLASITYWFPFDFILKTNRLMITKSKWKWFGCICNFAYTLVYLGFRIVRAIPKYGGFTKNSMIFHVYAIIHETALVAMHIHAFIYYEDMIILFNQLVNFNIVQGKRYLDQVYLSPNFREKLVHAIHICFWVFCVLNIGFFIFEPHQSHYWYSLVPVGWQNVWVLCLFIPIEVFVPIKLVIGHLFSLFYWFICIVTTNYWVTKISVGWSNCPEKFHQAMHLYSCIYILNKTYNEAFGSFIVPFTKTMIEFIFLMTAVGTIRLYGRVEFIIYLFFPTLLIIVFLELGVGITMMSRVHDVSNEIQNNYQLRKQKPNSKYMDLSLKACRPLRCQLTGAIFIEKSTRLVILDMILGWTVFVLLTFPADK